MRRALHLTVKIAGAVVVDASLCGSTLGGTTIAVVASHQVIEAANAADAIHQIRVCYKHIDVRVSEVHTYCEHVPTPLPP